MPLQRGRPHADVLLRVSADFGGEIVLSGIGRTVSRKFMRSSNLVPYGWHSPRVFGSVVGVVFAWNCYLLGGTSVAAHCALFENQGDQLGDSLGVEFGEDRAASIFDRSQAHVEFVGHDFIGLPLHDHV